MVISGLLQCQPCGVISAVVVIVMVLPLSAMWCDQRCCCCYCDGFAAISRISPAFLCFSLFMHRQCGQQPVNGMRFHISSDVYLWAVVVY